MEGAFSACFITVMHNDAAMQNSASSTESPKARWALKQMANMLLLGPNKP